MNKQDYQQFLVENKFDQTELDYSYVKDTSNEAILEQIKEIETYITENSDFTSYSENEKNTHFKMLFEEKYVKLKDIMKNETWYSIKMTGAEYNMVWKHIHDNCTYDATSVYYAIHLDSTLFKRYNAKYDVKSTIDVQLLSGEAVLLYELMCKKTLSGLTTEGYMFASVLRKLAECTKIYNYYDELSAKTYKKIAEWNLGLSFEEVGEFKENIAIKMAKEITSEATTA